MLVTVLSPTKCELSVELKKDFKPVYCNKCLAELFFSDTLTVIKTY